VGDVLNCQLADNAQGVIVRARVRREYAPLVRVNSKFWNAGGIDLRIGLFKGAEISAQSAQTLISGGIEFATPTGFGNAASNGAVFDLNDKPKDEWKNWAPSIPLNLVGQEPAGAAPTAAKMEMGR
jgi:paraquat-inducible protein B